MRVFWNLPWMRFLRRCVFRYYDKQIPRGAACLSYFLLLSIFPFLICITAFLDLLQLDVDAMLRFLDSVVPDLSQGILRSYLGYVANNQSLPLFIAGIFATILSASAAFRTILSVLTGLYPRQKSRSMFAEILISIVLPIALLLTIYFSIGAVLMGEWFLQWLDKQIPFSLAPLLSLWDSLRFLLLFCLFLLFLVLLSRLAAPRDVPQGILLMGNILTAVALAGASALFSWFIGLSTRYSLIYGSLVSVVVLLLWLYLCGNILFLGNIISSVWYEHYLSSHETEALPPD